MLEKLYWTLTELTGLTGCLCFQAAQVPCKKKSEDVKASSSSDVSLCSHSVSRLDLVLPVVQVLVQAQMKMIPVLVLVVRVQITVLISWWNVKLISCLCGNGIKPMFLQSRHSLNQFKLV